MQVVSSANAPIALFKGGGSCLLSIYMWFLLFCFFFVYFLELQLLYSPVAVMYMSLLEQNKLWLRTAWQKQQFPFH